MTAEPKCKPFNKALAIETLKKTVILWSFLAKHRCCTKRKAYQTLGLKQDLNDCPLCAYASYNTPRGMAIRCRDCLLRKLWPAGCQQHNSPYSIWLHNRGWQKGTEAAKMIARMARKRITEINITGK